VTGKIVFENLKHRPMRSLLSILLIGVPVTLILCLVGLSHGLMEDSQNRQRAIGADIAIRPKTSSMLALSGAPIPEKLVDYVRTRIPHVKLATGVFSVAVENVTLGATAVKYDEFVAMSGPFDFTSGTAFQTPEDVIVSEIYADQVHAQVGSWITLLNNKWRVCGIFPGGKLAHIILPLATLQQRNGATASVNQIYIKLDNPAYTKETIAYLLDPARGHLEDYPILSLEELTSMLTVNRIPALAAFIGVVMGIGVVIGFAVVCLSMYMAVLQRTREIGILKSLGASKAFILRTILTEALLLGVGGTILGILMSYGAAELIHKLKPASMPMVMVYEWWIYAAMVTIGGALLGALYPGLSAAAHDPIEALSYE
jgi:putative ABC transport system permease protein